jgi:uncharacterized protein YqgV (UPF0045/DUF77 family)
MLFVVHALKCLDKGDPEQLWPLVREVHQACLKSGAEKVHTRIKIFEAKSSSPYAEDSIQTLTQPFRTSSGFVQSQQRQETPKRSNVV